MRRANRRRRRPGRRSGGAGDRIGIRAADAGRSAVVWVGSASRSIVAFAREAKERVVERVEGAERNLANRARGTRGRTSVKRGPGLGRRVNEIASSLHGRGFILWAAALVTGLVCVWQHVHSDELALEIESLRNVRETVETDIGLLEMECADLSRRQRIEEYAVERLGMRYPRAGEVIWLGRSDSGLPMDDRGDYVMGRVPGDSEG